MGLNRTRSSHILRNLAPVWAVLGILVMPGISAAQDVGTPAETKPMTAEIEAELTPLRDSVIDQRETIADLERRVLGSEEPATTILRARIDKAWIRLLTVGVKFAERVLVQQKAGYDIGTYGTDAVAVLETQSDIVDTIFERLSDQLVLPASDLSAAGQAAGYTKFFAVLDVYQAVYDQAMADLRLASDFGVDVTAKEARLQNQLLERANNASVFLEISVAEVAGLRAGVSALPTDTELMAKLAIAEGRVRRTADVLEGVVRQMEVFGADTAEYRAQLLTATGAITTDLFNLEIIWNLLSRWGKRLLDLIAEEGPTFLFRLAVFAFIVYAALKLSRIVEMLAARGLSSRKFKLSKLLERMITSTVSNLILILGVMIALAQLGISLGPLLAGLGIAGFVIGFALQDTLSNFASGLMILFYRPFDVGDVVDAGGVMGTVNQMSLVNTTFLTFDNQTIVVPNSLIWSGVIKNVTAQKQRRVDLTFGIGYGDDIEKAEKVLAEIIEAHEKVLDDPEPTIKLHELGDSSVNFIVRPWVASDDYWEVYWDLIRTVKLRFDEEGISIPFPQRDVHLFSEDTK